MTGCRGEISLDVHGFIVIGRPGGHVIVQGQRFSKSELADLLLAIDRAKSIAELPPRPEDCSHVWQPTFTGTGFDMLSRSCDVCGVREKDLRDNEES